MVHHGERAEFLERLIVERLIERTDRLSDEALVAFIDGWRSLLDVLSRADLWLPVESSTERNMVEGLVERIRSAQERVLKEES